jgi:hypothetical protein
MLGIFSSRCTTASSEEGLSLKLKVLKRNVSSRESVLYVWQYSYKKLQDYQITELHKLFCNRDFAHNSQSPRNSKEKIARSLFASYPYPSLSPDLTDMTHFQADKGIYQVRRSDRLSYHNIHVKFHNYCFMFTNFDIRNTQLDDPIN